MLRRFTSLEGVPNTLLASSRNAAERRGDRWQTIFGVNTCLFPCGVS